MSITLKIAVLVIAGAVLFTGAGCKKGAEKNVPGPGGLPSGIVRSENAPASETEFPVFPGATQRATGVYETSASMDEVVAFYKQQFGVDPEITGAQGETRTFRRPQYTLVILSSVTGGTEINFAVKREAPPAN
jgi:hypothetical protein